MGLLDRNRLPLTRFNPLVTGTNWTTAASYVTPFQDSEGTWNAIINIHGSLSVGASVFTATVAGLTFATRMNGQPLYAFVGVTAAIRLQAAANGGDLQMFSGSAQTIIRFAGVVELASKPTFME